MLVMILLAVVVRWGSYYPTVIVHDESTYIVIANELLSGSVYWRDVIDTKPIGIFLIYGLLQLLSGGSIFLMRLLTSVIVGITGGLLFSLAKSATGSNRVGWAAGIGYVIIISIFAFYGVAPNTEIFINAFTVAAVFVVWCRKNSILNCAFAGLLLGFAFMIKPVASAEALLIGVYLLWVGWQRKRLLTSIFRWCLPLTIAFFLPLGAIWLFYQRLGMSDAFLYYTFILPGKYGAEPDLLRSTVFMFDFLGRFVPFTILAVAAFLQPLERDRPWQIFNVAWLVLATIIVISPGRYYAHYQIQLMPALVGLAATWWHPNRTNMSWLRMFFVKYGKGLFITTVALLSIGLFWNYAIKMPDEPAVIARELNERYAGEYTLYTGDSHQILYHLLDKEPVVGYIHPTLLFMPYNYEPLGVEPIGYIDSVFIHNPPDVVLLRLTDLEVPNPVAEAIRAHCHPVDTLLNKVVLLENNGR